ncbi:MAG TPA: hypothetical protein VFR84_17405 [Candidatus Angelobacter sp.]|nr:hypothetical protein [Candidatus Angelobacter sp.]
MSTAVLEPIVEQPVAAKPAAVTPVAAEEARWSDPHPLLPVFIAGAISAVLTGGFIGAILIWLATRHSGIMAP